MHINSIPLMACWLAAFLSDATSSQQCCRLNVSYAMMLLIAFDAESEDDAIRSLDKRAYELSN